MERICEKRSYYHQCMGFKALSLGETLRVKADGRFASTRE